jgi:hypothetical protein
MSDARPELNLRHVILPWAQPDLRLASPAELNRGRQQDQADAMKVGRDRLSIQKRSERDVAERPPVAGSKSTLPPLAAAILPFKPHPSIPDADRGPFETRGLVSLAVVLDVLATLTRQLKDGSTILADLTGALLEVGSLGGIDAKAEERLIAHAASRAGQIRATLSRQVASRMQARPLPEAEITATAVTLAVPSTPRAVRKAVQRVEAATEVVLREARLRLEAQEKGTEYRQA